MDKADRETQLVQEARDGLEAESLVNHTVWKETIAALEEHYIASIRNSNWLHITNGGINLGRLEREENTRRLQVLDDLVALINIKIETGELALKRLEANSNGSKQRRN